jgi:ATP-dependent Lon protease
LQRVRVFVEQRLADLEEVPESVARRLETIFVTDADEVIEDALRRA